MKTIPANAAELYQALKDLRENIDKVSSLYLPQSTTELLKQVDQALNNARVLEQPETRIRRYALTWGKIIPEVSPRKAAERAMVRYFDPSAKHLAFEVVDIDTQEKTTVDLNQPVPCDACDDGEVVSDTCDDCGQRHCQACDPCQDEEDLTPASTGRPNNNAI